MRDFHDMKQFEFLNLVKVFATWNGVVHPEKVNLLNEMYGAQFDIRVLQSILFFIYNNDFTKSVVMKY